jgi:CheY-like chemotaxis protein
LELLGHQVRVAANGPQGLEQVLEWHPDAALVDIGLPELDGYQLAQQVRAVLGGQVFLIALTAYTTLEDRQLAQKAGFNAHISKPTDLDDLIHLLASSAVSHCQADAASTNAKSAQRTVDIQ